MRSTQTPAERRLWSILRAGRLNGVKFTRQVLIGNFIVDFASRSERLAIEVDGDTHATQVDYDLRRTAWLEAAGYHVLRFTNAEVMENLAGVATMISRAIEGRSPHPQPSPQQDRKRVVSGKSVSVRVDLGGRRIIK